MATSKSKINPKPTERPQWRDILSSLAFGSLFALSGLIFLIAFLQVKVLNCTRLEPSQVTCGLESKLLGVVPLGSRPVPGLQGARLAEELSESTYEDSRGRRQTRYSQLYWVALLTAEGELALDTGRSSWVGSKAQTVERINAFVRSRESGSLRVYGDRSALLFSWAPLLFMAPGLFILKGTAKSLKLKLLSLTVLALTGLFYPTLPARAFTIYTVTRFDDPDPDSCLPEDCSLREAVRAANASPGHDLVALGTGTYTLTLAAMNGDSNAANGDLDITDDVTIQGTGAANSVIDGNYLDAILQIFNGVSVTLNAVTLQKGQQGYGGAIYSDGDLTLNESVVRQSIAPTGTAGGIYQNSGSTLTLNHSEVSQNSALAGTGGGIYNLGTVKLNHSLVSGNRSQGGGGGLANTSGTLYVVNSTISGNRTDFSGGGILNWNGGRVELFNATLANNVADNDNNIDGSGGGIHTATGAVVVTRDSLIGNNFNWEGLFSYIPDDCVGTLVAVRGNLIETMTNCNLAGSDPGDNITGQDPQLGLLADNGGSTYTHALQPGSPAIDGGSPSGCREVGGQILATDQRGYLRPVDGGSGQTRCDIGAFEFGASAPPAPTPTPAPAPAPAGYQLYLPVVMK